MLCFLLGLFKSLINPLLKLFGIGDSNDLPALEESKMLSVNIKTNLGEQIFVELDPDWTISQVKEKLLKELKQQGGNPNLRLLFAGKLLPDNLILNKCDLGQNSVLHAVHPLNPPDGCKGYTMSIRYTPTVETTAETIKENSVEEEKKEADVSADLKKPTVNENKSKEKNELNVANSDISKLEVVDTITPNDASATVDEQTVNLPVNPVDCNLLCDASTVMTIQLTKEEQEQIRHLIEKVKKDDDKDRPHFYVYCVKPCASIKIGKLRVRCSKCKEGAVTLQSDPTCWRDVLNPQSILCECSNQNCSEETYAEFYFKCSDHVTSGEDDTAVSLYMIRTNVPRAVCLSCGDISTPVFVFQCEDSHVLCLDCFITYSLSKLSERQFTYDAKLGYTLPCPVNCSDSLVEEIHHFRLLGEQQYTRYQRWATEEAVMSVGGLLCPSPGCGNGIIPDPECLRIVCTQGCGHVFCRNCLQDYHTGTCWRPGIDEIPGTSNNVQTSSSNTNQFSVDVNRSVGGGWDIASAAAIQTLTKPCPKCKTPTERSGGCMHMVCTRASCKYNWCWVCHTEWTRDCMASHWFG